MYHYDVYVKVAYDNFDKKRMMITDNMCTQARSHDFRPTTGWELVALTRPLDIHVNQRSPGCHVANV